MQVVNNFDRTLEFEIEIEIDTEIDIEIESNEGGRCKHYKYWCQSKCEYNHISLLFVPGV
jgi:hypothetical protein